MGLGFLLLRLAFRSVVVPLTAAIMNLVAAAAGQERPQARTRTVLRPR
ncbi:MULTISPECIES: hypothetical protein [unclassified Frankia]